MSTQQQYEGPLPGHQAPPAPPAAPAPHGPQGGWPGQQNAGHQAPAAGGYTSPIPMARTHLGHALVSEWTKIRSVRSTMWTLGVMFALVVGIGLLTAVGLSGDSYTGMPLLSGGLFGLMLGQICVITLGVLVITSEYGTGMIRTTLTACPRRGRVLLAKAVVFFVLAFVMTTLACSLTALVHSTMLSGQEAPAGASGMPGTWEDGTLVASGGEWFGATVGAGLYVALLGLLSLAIGALLRHSAGAITLMLGVVLLPLVMALFMAGEALATVREKLIEFSPLNGLASLYRIPMAEDQDATGWPLLGGLACVTLVFLVLAYTLLNKRDV
ncbi:MULTISPECIES: ABC transporter permease subunit [Streptomyces]|uniref:ABC transporter n=1 Tax=Streptomyces cacaoi TaxID=1898 RepID=A0A4Y3QYH9_STRCI|nr:MULTISPECIES: ABC transporter permease subunit [Streptomyces]NNG83936.1 ABC transporter permease subunit [Streptomyces cacaoi]QHF96913.1 ABC transporter permease [Streptomyces sp. NHF165]GEB50464.1 ABC transporter [Streptomyces cacaoi]